MRKIAVAMVLLSYFMLFFAVTFVWPTWRLWRRTGVNALVLPRDDSAHGVIAIWFKGLIVGIFVLLVAVAAGLPPDTLGMLAWLNRPAAAMVGAALLGASLIWIVVAQAQMGASWRIGIDNAARPPLVHVGLFARSRNPIFLGMRLNLAGLLLVLQNAVTLAMLLLGEALMQVQVRLEEAHLTQVFGDDYADYSRENPRWL